MIQANELRSGNLVFKNGIIVTIDGISIFDIECQAFTAKLYYGIPLTEQWLTKVGFEDYGELYKKIRLENNATGYISIRNDTPTYAEVAHEGQRSCIAPCQYVHQLQNLHFALTGKELTIKQ